MPSRFPGMDPFLEHPSVWEEFHHVFITECMYDLGERLPPGCVARIQKRVQSISIADQAASEYVPEVAVARTRTQRRVETTGRRRDCAGDETGHHSRDNAMEVGEGHVEILRLPDYELVTSVEILSPWNKFGEGVGIYREKRRSLVQRGVHVVEIDLLFAARAPSSRCPCPRATITPWSSWATAIRT